MAKAGQEVPSKWPPANSAKHMTGAKEKNILYSSEGLQDLLMAGNKCSSNKR